MKQLSVILAFLTLGTFAMYSQVKVVLEKDVKSENTEMAKSVVTADSAVVAANDNLKTAEELEAIINELSYKNREKVIERNPKTKNRKSKKRS